MLTHALEPAKVAGLAQAHQVGQVVAVLDHADTRVRDPDAIDAIHVHSQRIGDQDFDDDIVGRDQHIAAAILQAEPILEIEHALEDVAEALAAGHLGASRVQTPLTQALAVGGDHLVGQQALPVAVVDLEQGRLVDKRDIGVVAGDRFSGLGSTLKRAGEDYVERLAAQAAGQRLSLL